MQTLIDNLINSKICLKDRLCSQNADHKLFIAAEFNMMEGLKNIKEKHITKLSRLPLKNPIIVLLISPLVNNLYRPLTLPRIPRSSKITLTH